MHLTNADLTYVASLDKLMTFSEAYRQSKVTVEFYLTFFQVIYYSHIFSLFRTDTDALECCSNFLPETGTRACS